MATAAVIREHYDSLALVYRTFWGGHIHHGLFEHGDESSRDAQVKMLDHCTRLLRLRGGEKVLDVGCGYGGTLVHLVRMFDCRGTGLTISPKQARIAQGDAIGIGLADRLNFLVENAATFRFPLATFDLVWAMESSEHFSDKWGFFRNAARTLRPHGRLLLAAWTGSMDRQRVRQVARAFLCPELWTAQKYCTALESTGMRALHCEDLTAKVLRTWEICRKGVFAAKPVVKLLPRSAREFVQGIDIILDAYRSGDLTYTVLVAQK